MLILSRKPGESIVIDGKITIRIMRVEGEVVKVGIEAPVEIPVHRQEVYDEIRRSNKEAVTEGPTKLPQMPTSKSTPPQPDHKGPTDKPNRPNRPNRPN